MSSKGAAEVRVWDLLLATIMELHILERYLTSTCMVACLNISTNTKLNKVNNTGKGCLKGFKNSKISFKEISREAFILKNSNK